MNPVVDGRMVNPAWFLFAWVVVAAASLLKFWRITAPWRQRGFQQLPGDADAFRASLERRWKVDREA